MTPNSPEEKSARQFGIRPKNDTSDVAGRIVSQKVYLGCRISTDETEKVLPMFEPGAALEYELSRSISLAADKSKQKTIAILDTDAHFGGPEFEGERVDWAYTRTMSRLKKLYDVRFIDQANMGDYIATVKPKDPPKDPPADGDAKSEAKDQDAAKETSTPEMVPPAKKVPDLLIVADPSSLTSVAMDQLIQYLDAGNPCLFLVDPLPFFFASQNPRDFGVFNAPRQPRVSRRSPYQRVLTSSNAPKADNGRATKLLERLGIEWDNGTAVWGLANPHPNFKGAWNNYLGETWPELFGPQDKAFVWAHSDEVFEKENAISGGLNEILFFYPGSVKPADEAKTTFTPLVTLPENSGATPWSELTLTPKSVERARTATGQIVFRDTAASSQITGDDLVLINPDPKPLLDNEKHVLAAQIKDDKLNCVVICDLDFVSDFYYQQEDALEQGLDNLRLFENSIDVLLGETGFVSLRNRRASPSTLTTLEEWTNALKTQTALAKQDAEKKSREALDAEQKKLDEAMKKISKDDKLSIRQRLQQTFTSQSDSQRKYELRKLAIDRELNEQLDILKTEEQQKTKSLVDAVQRNAILFAPLPALLLGVLVLSLRTFNENRHISDERRV